MVIELTEQQVEALGISPGEPVQAVDPRTNTTYVLLRAEEFENVREILKEEKRQQAIGAIAQRNAISRLDEFLTIAEIKERFPDEWVLLTDPETNDVQEVLSGKVILHSKDREEFDQKMIQLCEKLAPSHIAVLYTGEMPEDIIFAL